ncbi:unnamed protein product [Gongylonema pulchrum]|uniref:Secreted protein n=1 Tax=Gongylonema pulchrum TaxID=637853 RepID=A0A183CXZ1_9BILA|nr:unnamed protein product [Gongylonema pulchrum]
MVTATSLAGQAYADTLAGQADAGGRSHLKQTRPCPKQPPQMQSPKQQARGVQSQILQSRATQSHQCGKSRNNRSSDPKVKAKG